MFSEQTTACRESLKWVPFAFCCAIALVILIGGGVTRWLFPALAAVTAYLLYRGAPVTYIRFVWWVWFLAPFVRRVVDYRNGWVDPSPILLAPPLVSLVCFPSLFQKSVWTGLPGVVHVLTIGSVTYGLLIGLVCLQPQSAVAASLSWFAPLTFALHLTYVFSDRARWAAYSHAIQWTFVWGLLVLGIYGVVQLVIAPLWDQNWMIRSEMTSIGIPEPFGIRVFSTMNSPGPLGFVLAAGLLVIADRSGVMPLLARIAGYASLTLCLARSAWMAWFLGAMYLGLRRREQVTRLVVMTIVLAICLCVMLTYDPIKDVVQTRLESFGQMHDDESYQDRQNGYERTVRLALQEPLGRGLGAMDLVFNKDIGALGSHDSGLWELLLSLGWPGGLAYSAGLLLSIVYIMTQSPGKAFLYIAGGSVAFGMIPQMLLGSVMIGASGMVLWSVIGISLGYLNALSLPSSNAASVPVARKCLSASISH